MKKRSRRVKKTRLAWNCGDELLKRLKGAKREKLRREVSDEVLAALQYHSTTDDVGHVVLYMDGTTLVVDYALPDCQRRIDLREIVEVEIEMHGGRAEEVAGLELLFEDLARLCREARLENRPASGQRMDDPATGATGPIDES